MNTLFETKIKYKVLTLWEPWASLLVFGSKKIETRPKPTSWTSEKGVYLIHSAKKWSKEQNAICRKEPFKTEISNMPACGVIGEEFALGYIIGSIEVIECKPIWEVNSGIALIGPDNKDILITGNELEFGDYREGRYAWICQNPKILETPIPYKNGQGYYQNFKGDIDLLKFKS
jgi:activating signal cointegrator 1